MAMRSDRGRSGERGLSLIEALVIVTVTALIAALLLPVVSRATGRNFSLADRSLDAAALAEGEEQFRALLQAMEQPPTGEVALDGAPLVLTFLSDVAEPAACSRPGDRKQARLRIVSDRNGGRLVCDAGDERRELARWPRGSARFSYSTDGVVWLSSLQVRSGGDQVARGGAVATTIVAPFVRFDLDGGDGTRVTWVARAGWTEAADINRGAAAQPIPTP